jgi:hypothetical protein
MRGEFMFERLMARTLPVWVLALTIQTMLLGMVVFGAIVSHAVAGGERLGYLGKISLQIASIPLAIVRAIEPDKRMNATKILPVLPDGLWVNPNAGVKDDGYLLISRYRPERKRYVVEILSLLDGKVLHSYAPNVDAINSRSEMKSSLIDLERDRREAIYTMLHPMLTPTGGVISQHASPLVSIDRCSKIEWTIDGIFHHAIERDAGGNYWVGYRYPKSAQPNVSKQFHDEALAQVSPSGKLLRLISVRGILSDNNLLRLIDTYGYTDDPYHLNDIEPALVDGKFWKAGDLFLSFRNFSGLVLFRPATGRVIWLRQGLTLAQHDIQILDDHRIAVFDNNARPGWPRFVVDGSNRIMIYDFIDNKISYPFDAVLAKEKVETPAQGRQIILANGDTVIEETEHGRILRLAPDGTVRWRYISAQADGTRTILGWSRYLERTRWQSSVDNAVKGNCS